MKNEAQYFVFFHAVISWRYTMNINIVLSVISRRITVISVNYLYFGGFFAIKNRQKVDYIV